MLLQNIEFREIEPYDDNKETFKSAIFVNNNQASHLIGTGNPMCDLEVEIINAKYFIEFLKIIADVVENNKINTTIDIRVQQLKNNIILFEIDNEEVCLIDSSNEESSITIKDEWQLAIIVNEVYAAIGN